MWVCICLRNGFLKAFENAQQKKFEEMLQWNHLMTLCEVLWWELSRSVTKNLTAYRLNSGVWGLDDMKREIHSFPTMYIMGGGKWCRNGSKLRFSQKKWPKNSFLEWHKSGSTDFGGVWHPYFWRYRYFPHVFWKIWSMIFELSYVQGVNLR